MASLTISGQTFEVEPRYSEGHTLTANEAAALNQTFFENIRNNCAAKVKEGATQADIDAYVSTYQFGVRTGGGGSRDPVEVEAMNMARDSVKDAIRKSGKNISDFTAKAISEAASKLIARDPKFRELARQRVAELQSQTAGAVDNDLMAMLEESAKEEQADASTAEGKPAKPAKEKAA